MDFAGYKYYQFSETSLKLLGLWPYQKVTWLVHGQRLIINLLFIDSVVFQLMTCVTTKCDMDILLKLSAFVSMAMVFILKYLTFCIIVDKLKLILMQIERDWNMLKSEEELKILRNGAEMARIVTVTWGFLLYTAAACIIIYHVSPYILDIVVPLNESRPHIIPCRIELFFDQQRFYTLIMLHIDVVTITGSSVMLATEAMLILMFYHACGLIMITSHRLKTLDDDKARWSVEKMQLTHRKIVDIVKMHIRSNEFMDQIMSTLGISYFILAFVGVITVTASLFRLHQAIVLMNDFGELAASITHVCLDLFYMFFCNYYAQQFVDYNTEMFHAIYNNVQWYEAPIFIQKLLLTIMHRAVQDNSCTVGGIYTASYTGFITLLKMSVSYFMVISSLVQ